MTFPFSFFFFPIQNIDETEEKKKKKKRERRGREEKRREAKRREATERERRREKREQTVVGIEGRRKRDGRLLTPSPSAARTHARYWFTCA